MNSTPDPRPPTLDPQQSAKNFSSVRLIAIAFPLIVIGAFLTVTLFGYLRAGDLSEKVPPTGAFVLFVPVFLFCAVVPALRRRWQVTRGELVVLFSMLFLGVSVAGSGFWHHFVASQIEFHRSRDLDWAMTISPNLWPNHGNLLEDRSAEDDLSAWAVSNQQTTTVVECPDGPGQCVRIAHESSEAVSHLELQLKAAPAERGVQPLHRYAVFARIRLDDPGPRPVATLRVGPPDQQMAIASVRTATQPNQRAPDRFVTVGMIDYKAPWRLGDRFDVRLKFAGQGVLYVRDFSIISTEEVYRFFEGYKDATPPVHSTLADVEAPLVRVRPTQWWNPTYLKHVLLGLVPWDAWFRPLLIWSVFVVATFLALYCLVTIFYRQWDEGERLTFPLQTFVLEATKTDEKGRLSIFRAMPFWIGLALCSFHLSFVELNTYFPDLPRLNLDVDVSKLMPEGGYRDAMTGSWGNEPFTFGVHPLFVAVAFFVSLEISGSLVFFYLASWVYQVAFYFTPLKVIKASSPHHFPGFPYSWLMATGGLLCLACLTIFTARKHLARVATKVFLGRGQLDDSDQAMSYRGAVLGLLVAAVLFVVFAQGAEISATFVLVYMAILFCISLALTRLRAEAGIPANAVMVYWPQAFIVGIGSSLTLGYRQVTFTSQACFLYVGSFLMIAPILAESMAGAVRCGVPLRKVGRCMIGAFVIATIVGGMITMSWGYTAGALNLGHGLASKRGVYNRMTTVIRGDDDLIAEHFGSHPNEPRIVTDEKALEIAKFQPVTLLVTGVSFAITGLLALARVIWLGFPLHPIGFALAFSSPMHDLWASIAVAALVKYLGLRFGGVHFNRRILRPAFVGIFVGALLMDGSWSVVRGIVNAATGGGAVLP